MAPSLFAIGSRYPALCILCPSLGVALGHRTKVETFSTKEWQQNPGQVCDGLYFKVRVKVNGVKLV